MQWTREENPLAILYSPRGRWRIDFFFIPYNEEVCKIGWNSRERRRARQGLLFLPRLIFSSLALVTPFSKRVLCSPPPLYYSSSLTRLYESSRAREIFIPYGLAGVADDFRPSRRRNEGGRCQIPHSYYHQDHRDTLSSRIYSLLRQCTPDYYPPSVSLSPPSRQLINFRLFKIPLLPRRFSTWLFFACQIQIKSMVFGFSMKLLFSALALCYS